MILVGTSHEAGIGAGEINQRIESLGGQALPIAAEHRARMMQVQAAINQGDRGKSARLLSEAKTSLESAALAWRKIDASVDKKKLMWHYTKRSNPYGYVSSLDISELEKEVDELATHYEQRITARTMPAWFLKSLDRRRVKVGRTAEGMKIDCQLPLP